LNAGARAATKGLLLFLHADCWLEAGALAEVAALLSEPRVGSGVFRQKIEGDSLVYRLIESAASLRVRWRRCPYGDSGLFLRRADFVRIGGFPELPLCEDMAMATKLQRLGPIALARSCIHLSARRWQQHGVIKTTLVNAAVAWAFRLGVAPAKLYRWYYGREVPESAATGMAARSPGAAAATQATSEATGEAGEGR